MTSTIEILENRTFFAVTPNDRDVVAGSVTSDLALYPRRSRT